MRTNLTPAEWGKCKAFVRRRSNDRCEICGGRGPQWPVECHEQWRYDDTEHVQSLGLIALCPPCHKVKHLGHAQVVGDYDAAFSRLMVGNAWTPAMAQSHVDAAFATWQKRSRHQWTLDASWLSTIGVQPPEIKDRPGGAAGSE